MGVFKKNLVSIFETRYNYTNGIAKHILKRDELKFNPYSDILYCPVCNQDIDIEEYTVVEIMHIERHLRNIGLFLIEEGIFQNYEENREYRKIPILRDRYTRKFIKMRISDKWSREYEKYNKRTWD